MRIFGFRRISRAESKRQNGHFGKKCLALMMIVISVFALIPHNAEASAIDLVWEDVPGLTNVNLCESGYWFSSGKVYKGQWEDTGDTERFKNSVNTGITYDDSRYYYRVIKLNNGPCVQILKDRDRLVRIFEINKPVEFIPSTESILVYMANASYSTNITIQRALKPSNLVWEDIPGLTNVTRGSGSGYKFSGGKVYATSSWDDDREYFKSSSDTGITYDESTYYYRMLIVSGSSSVTIYCPGQIDVYQYNRAIDFSLSNSIILVYPYSSGSANITIQRAVKNNLTTLSVNNPIENKYYGKNDTSVVPSIIVSDKDNNNVTCKYYIDTETTAREVKTVTNTATAKTVNFNPINMTSLSDGNHSIKFEVSDGIATVTSLVRFKIDKSSPVLGTVSVNSSPNQITVTGSATDSLSGLHATPYRYTIGSNISSWITSTSYTQGSLLPNTGYAVKFEARDAISNIASSTTQTIYTKALMPNLSIKNATSYTLDIEINDTNPIATVYQIVNTATNKYLTSAGDETTIPTWIRPNNKIQTVRNLSPQTSYSYKIQAKNEAGVETGFSAPATGTTLATPPPKVGELTATAEMNSITIHWDLVGYATSYEIEGDGVILGTAQGTSFTHTGLITGTEHIYRVRGKNGNVAGPWSEPISKSTLPPAPQAPANINTFATRNNITVTWNSVNGATAYDIEVDGDILSNGNSTNYVHAGLTPNTSHSYRVRSINPAGKSEWSNMLTVITQDEALPIPQNIVVEPLKTKITVTWSMIPGLTYQVEADGNIKNTGALSEYVHDNLIADTEHTYRIRSVKDGSYSDWSRLIIVRTKADIFTVPSNIQGKADDAKISVSWDAVTNAESYEIDSDGVVIDNGNNTSFIHESLSPNSSHTYRVRAKNDSEVSQWSDPLTISTYALSQPQNVIANGAETEIALSWDRVANAESYELKVDGNTIRNINGTTYTITGLLKGSQYSISIRAVNSQGTSAFTTPILVLTQGEGNTVPQNIGAIRAKDQIALIWGNVVGADGYEVKIGDQIITDLTTPAYTHKNLVPNTDHIFMVRSIKAGLPGQWSEPITIKTMSLDPAIPTNITAATTTSTVLLTWNSVADAEEYEVQIGDVVKGVGASLKYLHTGLTPNTQYTYRVRSKNKTGVSPWSEPVTAMTSSSTQAFRAIGAVGEERDLVVTASNITNFQGHVFTLTYNPDELEITDVSSLTAKKDENSGNIIGTDIEVIQNQLGILQFKKHMIIPQGQAYTGVINSIRFKLKTTNEVIITYTTK
ncbi:hypothetical protein HNQ80_000175 [Anaerosolibacter carboniphilus]|uniref:Fibronectin type-III domain-containing protein n=1 Tax=Anaerosolibacter carboniphilus TaxID=1417629 RepID=A0A841KL73_9FIRM|nr:fibronectin type III domain-containing protein [Anaerosolibacter carboniphilus]MBB6214106.1 hypothetical protein [Anaerosolibacter carboniphilus]